MRPRIQHLVLDPDGFFAEESGKRRLWAPALVVLTVGVLEVARQLYVSSYTSAAMEDAGVGGGMTLLFTLPNVVAPFVSWLLATAVVVAVAFFLGGEGSGRDTLEAVGWGYVPGVLSAVAALAVTVYFLGGGEAASIEDAVETQTALFEAMQTLEYRGFRYTLVAWQGFIWTFAVKHVHDFELKRAVIPAGVVVALILGMDVLATEVVQLVMG